MPPSVEERLRAVDWMAKPEATVCSQLIMPVLGLLGYGEDTMHKVLEQRSYMLRDPYVSKGHRRVRLDYEPRVYEEGLWVMEAKGTDESVQVKTLGQVRDYAIHPEVRAALMVTVDAAGFRVFDPWDEYWDEPLLEVGVNEVVPRLGELRAVLGVDRVSDVIRQRQFDHLRRTLSASLEFGVLNDAEREFRELMREARSTISEKRSAVHRQAAKDAEDLHQRVLENSGVGGLAQHENSPFIGRARVGNDFATAVLSNDEPQRPTQIQAVKPAIEAVFSKRVAEGAERYRPLWWLRVVELAGALKLRGEKGCEPYASDLARAAARDCLLAFPDDQTAAASWRFQRVGIPFTARVCGLMPLDEMAAKARESMSAENQIRYRPEPSWFFMHLVRMTSIRMLASVDPWRADELDKAAAETKAHLERMPLPDSEWVGPMGDDWLQSWATRDPLLMCGLAMLNDYNASGDLLDEPMQEAIRQAASSGDALLERPAQPLAKRLGL
jgi:hypothetical protein